MSTTTPIMPMMITLKEVVDQVILDQRYGSNNQFSALYPHALRGLRELYFNVFTSPWNTETAILPVENGYATLPVDFIDVDKAMGVGRNQRLYEISIDRRIQPTISICTNAPAPLPATLDTENKHLYYGYRGDGGYSVLSVNHTSIPGIVNYGGSVIVDYENARIQFGIGPNRS